MWTKTTSLYQSKGAVDAAEQACTLCGCHIQNDWAVEQWICIKFCVKLEHSSTKSIQIIQKAAAMGNWWLAASSGQHACSCITSHAECFGKKHQITQVTQHLLQPDLVAHDFWFFPKLKSPLKGKGFQTVNEIQVNTAGQLMAIEKPCEVPRCLLWRGLRHCCTMYNVSSSINVSIVHVTWLHTFWRDTYIPILHRNSTRLLKYKTLAKVMQ